MKMRSAVLVLALLLSGCGAAPRSLSAASAPAPALGASAHNAAEGSAPGSRQPELPANAYDSRARNLRKGRAAVAPRQRQELSKDEVRKLAQAGFQNLMQLGGDRSGAEAAWKLNKSLKTVVKVESLALNIASGVEATTLLYSTHWCVGTWTANFFAHQDANEMGAPLVELCQNLVSQAPSSDDNAVRIGYVALAVLRDNHPRELIREMARTTYDQAAAVEYASQARTIMDRGLKSIRDAI